MNDIRINNVKNIILVGDASQFKTEIAGLEESGEFQLYFSNCVDEVEKTIRSQMIHLMIIDGDLSMDFIKDIISLFYKKEFTQVPLLMATKDEIVHERCDYFSIGISNFYLKGHFDQFVDVLNRMDRDLTFKEGLKEMSVAVLDDDRLQIAVLKDMLQRNQILNVDFYSEPNALLAVEKSYDIYLIDLILPDVDGEIVMIEMRKKNENAVIIGISSIENKSTIAKVLSIGANDYITKPVHEQVFLAKLYSNTRVLMLLKENEIKKKILQELAIKDGLTSLYNHKHIHEMLDVDVKMAKRYGRDLSVIMLDIDNFKHVNDTYGHPVGDMVLMNVATIIKDTARESDIVGRYGGEEFIIILPETSINESMILGERIRKAIESAKFDNGICITISGGASTLLTDSEQLIDDADKRLYIAKRSGKNRIEFKKNIKESYLTS